MFSRYRVPGGEDEEAPETKGVMVAQQCEHA